MTCRGVFSPWWTASNVPKTPCKKRGGHGRPERRTRRFDRFLIRQTTENATNSMGPSRLTFPILDCPVNLLRIITGYILSQGVFSANDRSG